MEPDEAAVTPEWRIKLPKPEVRYVICTKVKRIFQSAEGPWFVHFDGSWEALSLGNEQPAFAPGDPVVITIQKAPQ